MITTATTTLPNGSSGECAYINNTDDTFWLEIPIDDSVIVDNSYVLSMYAKPSKATKISLTGGTKDTISIDVETGWNRIKIPFTLTSKTLTLTFEAIEIYLWRAQLEEGNVVSSWKQSEQDSNDNVDEKLSSYATEDQLNTAIELTEKTINLNITQNYSTTAEIEEQLKNYSTTEATKTAIELATDSITQSVEKTYTTKEETTALLGEVETLTETTKTTKTTAEQTASQFSWLVADDYSQSNVKLSSSAYDLIASNINIQGSQITFTADDYSLLASNITLSGDNVNFTATNYTNIANNITLRGNHIQLDADTEIGSGFILSADNINVNSLFAQDIEANNTIKGASLLNKRTDSGYVEITNGKILLGKGDTPYGQIDFGTFTPSGYDESLNGIGLITSNNNSYIAFGHKRANDDGSTTSVITSYIADGKFSISDTLLVGNYYFEDYSNCALQVNGDSYFRQRLYNSSGSYLGGLSGGGWYCSDALSVDATLLVGNTRYGDYALNVKGDSYFSGGAYFGGRIVDYSPKLQMKGRVAAWTDEATTEISVRAKNNNTGYEVGLAVGSSGTTHGVYSYSANKWIAYCDSSGSVYLKGNADTSTKWTTARTLTITGSVTGSVSIDGSGNVTLTTTNNTLSVANSDGTGMSIGKSATGDGEYYFKNNEYTTDAWMFAVNDYNFNVYNRHIKLKTKGYGLRNSNDNIICSHGDMTNYDNLNCFGNTTEKTSIYADGVVWKNGSTTTYISTTSTSDRRLKDVVSDLSAYEDIYMELQPIAFRYHYGLYNAPNKEPLIQWGYIAQDVIDAFNNHNIDWHEQELVVVEDGELTNEEKKYVATNDMLKMNYQNMIALNTHMIQKMFTENSELKQRIEALEKALNI